MSLLNSVKSIFKVEEAPFIVVAGTMNYGEIPLGFFRVETASGKESLGYKGATGWLSWDCGETVVDGGSRVTLSVPRDSLPLVKLNFKSASAGQEIGGLRVIDTDTLGWDGVPTYDGGQFREGVEYERA
jgi:hypothetical protein